MMTKKSTKQSRRTAARKGRQRAERMQVLAAAKLAPQSAWRPQRWLIDKPGLPPEIAAELDLSGWGMPR